jgi:hypothetical protein
MAQQPKTPAGAVKAIIEWCGTTDPAHVLATRLADVYRPTITTPAEADALPPNAVIKDADKAILQHDLAGKDWWQMGYEHACPTSEIVFPAVVIHPGEVAA